MGPFAPDGLTLGPEERDIRIRTPEGFFAAIRGTRFLNWTSKNAFLLALRFPHPRSPGPCLERGRCAAEQGFAHQGVAADAKRYETYLKANWKTDGKSAADLKGEAEKTFASDPRAASRALASAVGADDKDAAAWTRLAEALLAIKPDENKGSERYDLPVNASGAAYRGYELAKDKAQKAHALFVLGQTLERRSYWRPAIDALKFSLTLADDQIGARGL